MLYTCKDKTTIENFAKISTRHGFLDALILTQIEAKEIVLKVSILLDSGYYILFLQICYLSKKKKKKNSYKFVGVILPFEI
jgi:hypothetical protein